MRRFPPPWSVEEQDACFVVNHGAGQRLAYIYYEKEAGRRKDEARDRGQHRQAAQDLMGARRL
jgi:hypothetical protein